MTFEELNDKEKAAVVIIGLIKSVEILEGRVKDLERRVDACEVLK
jgi:hypothetical protein